MDQGINEQQLGRVWQGPFKGLFKESSADTHQSHSSSVMVGPSGDKEQAVREIR
jgi:hypothetical protein